MTVYQCEVRCAIAQESMSARRASLALPAGSISALCAAFMLVGAVFMVLVAAVPSAYASAPGPGAAQYGYEFEAASESGGGLGYGSDSANEQSFGQEASPYDEHAKAMEDSSGAEKASEAEAAQSEGVQPEAGQPELAHSKGDEAWKSQLGVWMLEHDQPAVDAAKQAAADAAAAAKAQTGKASGTLPVLDDHVPIAVALALASLGAGLAAMAAGRRQQRAMEACMAEPTKRRSTR